MSKLLLENKPLREVVRVYLNKPQCLLSNNDRLTVHDLLTWIITKLQVPVRPWLKDSGTNNTFHWLSTVEDGFQVSFRQKHCF